MQRSFSRLVAPTVAGIMTDALGVLAIGIVAIPALRAARAHRDALAALAHRDRAAAEPDRLRAPPRTGARGHPRPRGELLRARMPAARRRRHRPRGRWVALLASAGVGGLGALLIPLIEIGDPNSASRILAADSEFNRAHRAVQDKFGGSEPFVVIVEGDAPRALYRPALLRAMENFQRYLERLPVVAYSFSPVDIMKGMRERFNELEPKWGVIPSTEREVAETFFTYWGFIPPSTSARFFTPDFRIGQITFFCTRSRRAHGAQRRGRRRGLHRGASPRGRPLPPGGRHDRRHGRGLRRDPAQRRADDHRRVRRDPAGDVRHVPLVRRRRCSSSSRSPSRTPW